MDYERIPGYVDFMLSDKATSGCHEPINKIIDAALLQVVEAVEALHRPVDRGSVLLGSLLSDLRCSECGTEAPCATVRAARGVI